ncbi:MAG: hypothetical protein LR015_15560 [Verrucomicrobia bacterium]|nr:hypothetical protein [Verrucomicrobiota bacterium]
MPRKPSYSFKLSKVIRNGKSVFFVDGYNAERKRIRRYFDSKVEAQRFKQENEIILSDTQEAEKHVITTSLTQQEVNDLEICRNLLNGENLRDFVSEIDRLRKIVPGRSLSAVVHEFSSCSQIAMKHGVSLLQAIHYFDTHYRKPIKATQFLKQRRHSLRLKLPRDWRRRVFKIISLC